MWPTKWPQYTLILTPALCLAAATTVRQFYRLLKENETYWEWLRQMLPAPPLAFWMILGVIALAVVVGYTASTLQLSLGRLGWSHLTQQSALLPSNTVYDVAAGGEEQMILATERGAAIWAPPTGADLPDQWMVFTAQTSGLPSDHVLAVTVAPDGHLWLGTDAGLARYDGEDWQVYRAGDLGVVEAQVYALAVDRRGQLWAGTGAGAAVFDGQGWMAHTTANSGLVDNRVLALEIEPQPGGDRVWFGTRMGVSRLDTASGEWTSFPEAFDPSWGGVADLLLDSAGQLWAGTLGGGLGRWDGATWQFYRTGNSGIPFNTVNAVAEVEPGVLWVGTALPAEVGGVLAEFDGQAWRAYTRRDSGFSGAEPLAIAVDAQGRRWIGTRTSGVDIYQPDR